MTQYDAEKAAAACFKHRRLVESDWPAPPAHVFSKSRATRYTFPDGSAMVLGPVHLRVYFDLLHGQRILASYPGRDFYCETV